VLWVAGVGVATWHTFPVTPEWATLPSICDLPANERSEDWDCSWLARAKAQLVVLALAPPIFVLALGSALIWAVRGFRQL
jgi:hypothetical protein